MNPQDKEYVDLPHTYVFTLDNEMTFRNIGECIPAILEAYEKAGDLKGYSLGDWIEVQAPSYVYGKNLAYELITKTTYWLVFKTSEYVDVMGPIQHLCNYMDAKKNNNNNTEENEF
jgi:hypothetical protein